MPTTTKDDKGNCILAQFKTATKDSTSTNKCDTKWVLQKIKNLNSKVPATKYLQLHHTEWIGHTALHLAASNNNLDEFTTLLNHGADFTIKNNKNLTVLHHIIVTQGNSLSRAYKLNNILIHLVLSAHLQNKKFENPANDSGLTHFHIACAANNVEVVKGFLCSGVRIDHAVQADSSLFPGFTPLHFAARYCAFEVVEVLLSYSANVHIMDAKHMTPLHVSLEQKLKIIGEANLDKAVHDSYEKILKLFLESESNNDTLHVDEWGLSHFHVACTFKDSKIAECLLQNVVDINHSVNVDSQLWSGYTALHFAALCNTDIVKLLMKKGSDISIKDTKGVTPFDICIERYNAEDIYAVISLNPNWKNIILSDGKTRLTDLVFAMRNPNQFNMFLRKLSKDFSIYDSALWPGYTPMHLAVLFAKELPDTSEDVNVRIMKSLCRQNPSMLCSQEVHACTPLHLAYRLNKKPIISLLLKSLNKACPNLVDCIDEDGLSYLHIAAAENNIPLLKRMLSIGSDVNSVYRGKSSLSPKIYSGSTALHFAVINGSVEAVELLVRKGADMYAKDANDMTPIHMLIINSSASELITSNLKNSVVSDIGLSHLHIACMYENSECIESLLNDGADINGVITCTNEVSSRMPFLEKYAGCSPLHIAYERTYRPMKMLLERGADIFVKRVKEMSLFYNVLVDDCLSQVDDFVEVLMKNEDLQSRLKAETGMTALHIACLNPLYYETIEKLLDEGANVNAQIRSDSPIFQGYTALHVLLHLSVEYDVEDSMEVLIKKGADIMLPDAESYTPVHMAFQGFDESDRETYSYLNMMLEAQRDYSVNPVDVRGVTHFHIACRIANTSVIEEFLKNADIDINQQIDFFHDSWYGLSGQTALHLAASDKRAFVTASRQLNTVDLLLKHGANVHTEDAHGNTPLHKCALAVDTFTSESLDIFERLARAGAEVDARNIYGNTPVYYLLSSKDITCEGIKTLLRLGCRLNTFNTVTEIGYISEIPRSISEEDMEKLLTAVIVNFAQELKTDSIGRTVIHNLVSDDRSKCAIYSYAGYIEQLTRIGCDVDDQDEFGRTALHMATKFYNANGVSGLLMVGADVNVIDNNGETAFDYNVETCTFCETYGKNDNNRKCNHLKTLKTLTIHVKKLQMCGLDANEQNEELVIKAFEKLQYETALSEKFFKELETVKETTIGDQSLTIFDFLSETRAVANYPRMSWLRRKAVDKFFSSSKVKDLYKKFPELAGILLLQYRKARARPQLLQSAKNGLKILFGFELPEICSDHILVLLKNSELKSLTASTAI